MFASALVFRWPRRNHPQQRFRKRKRRRSQRSQYCRKRPSLFAWRNNSCRRLTIAAHRKRIVHPTDKFRRRLHLIPMQHVDRHQRVFNRRQRHALANIIVAKSFQRCCAHLHQPVQLIHRVRTRIPQMRQAARASCRPRVLIRQIPQASSIRIQQNFVQRRAIVHSRRKILIPEGDRNLREVRFRSPIYEHGGLREVRAQASRRRTRIDGEARICPQGVR